MAKGGTGRACTVCTHPLASQISKALMERESQRSVSARFGVSPAAACRHRTRCLRTKLRPGNAEKSAATRADGKRRDLARFDAGGADRCDKCGTLFSDPSPESLIKRSERVLRFGELIVQRAADDGDFRLGLQALDRVQRSLDQLLRVHGLLNPDTPPTNDNRQVNVFQGLSPDELRAAIKALSAPKSDGEEPATARAIAPSDGRRYDSHGVVVHKPEPQRW